MAAGSFSRAHGAKSKQREFNPMPTKTDTTIRVLSAGADHHARRRILSPLPGGPVFPGFFPLTHLSASRN